MRIREFHVENFNTIKSISLSERDLRRFVIVTGEHGNGKSSLLDALTYALTGYLEETIASYIRLGEDHFTIHCKVEDSSGIMYDMFINAREGRTEKILKISNESDVYRDSDATKRMAESFNPTLLLYSAIARQHNNTGVLFESDAERLKKLKKIFRINEVDDAVERIKKEESELRETVNLLKNEFETLVQQYESIKMQDVPVIEDDELSIAEEELKWLSLKESAYTYQIEKQKYIQSLERYNNAVENIKKLQGEIQYIQSEIDSLPPLKRFRSVDISDEIKKIISEINSLKQDFDDIQKEIDRDNRNVTVSQTLNQKKSELNSELIHLIGSIENYRKQLNDIDFVSIEPLEKSKESLLQRFRFLDIKKDSYNSGYCLVCNHPLSEDIDIDHEYYELKKSIDDVNDSIASARETNLRREKIIDQIHNLNARKDELEKKLSIIESDPLLTYKSLKNLLLEKRCFIQGKIDVLHSRFNELNVKQKEIDGYIEYNQNILNQRKRLNERLEIKKRELDSISEPVCPDPFNLVEVVFDEDGYKRFLDRKNKHIALLAKIKSVEEMNAKLLEQKNAIKNKIDLIQSEIDTKIDRLDTISSARKILEKKFTAFLLKRGSNYVCDKINEFFSKAFISKTLEDSYDIQMEVKGNSVQFFYRIGNQGKLLPIRKASGQQRMVISLAFRNALSDLSPFGGFFILDEVDESANAEASMKMYDILLENNVSQLIAITHNDATITMFRENPEASIFEIRNGELVGV